LGPKDSRLLGLISRKSMFPLLIVDAHSN
jgi:hypothetical protein